MDIAALRARLAATATILPVGRVRAVTGLAVRAALPGARIGDVVLIRRRGEPLGAEIVGFDGAEVVAMPLGDLEGVGPDDPVESTGEPLRVRASPKLLGRVLDGLGRPLDGGEPLSEGPSVRVDGTPPPRCRAARCARPCRRACACSTPS